jgi:prepilin-type processing-associated H-X9-DG protein
MPGTLVNPNLPPGSVTNYLAVIGPDSVFSKTGIKIQRITDGTSNSMMLVEANAERAVPWTKPVDHELSEKDPKAGLGGLRPGGFHMAMADGSVRFLAISVDPKTLRALITKSGNERIGDLP